MELRWYPSKVDGWIAVALALGPIACIATVVATALAGEGLLVAVVSSAVLLAVYGGLVFPMRYAVGTDAVIVRHGLITQRIPLAAITEVRPTRNPLSSPALSLDRLEITFGEGVFKHAMISPADKQGFLDELAARAGLRRDGDGLVRGA